MCTDCERRFYGEECDKAHMNSICSNIRRYWECFKILSESDTCGKVYCKICRHHQSSEYLCYVMPDEKAPQIKEVPFIFYDLDTRQETVCREVTEKGDTNILLLLGVNFCVFKQVCYNCINYNIELCNKCGVTGNILRVKRIERFTVCVESTQAV